MLTSCGPPPLQRSHRNGYFSSRASCGTLVHRGCHWPIEQIPQPTSLSWQKLRGYLQVLWAYRLSVGGCLPTRGDQVSGGLSLSHMDVSHWSTTDLVSQLERDGRGGRDIVLRPALPQSANVFPRSSGGIQDLKVPLRRASGTAKVLELHSVEVLIPTSGSGQAATLKWLSKALRCFSEVPGTSRSSGSRRSTLLLGVGVGCSIGAHLHARKVLGVSDPHQQRMQWAMRRSHWDNLQGDDECRKVIEYGCTSWTGWR